MSKYNSNLIDRNYIYREVPGTADYVRWESVYRRVIICLCGSTRFKAAWYEQTKRLTYEGYIVLGVGDLNPNAQEVNDSIDPEIRAKLDILHFDKIYLADAIFVLNVDGYVDESTRREVLYAARLGKTIHWLEPNNIPSDLIPLLSEEVEDTR